MLPEDDGVLEKAEGTKIDWKAGGSVMRFVCVDAMCDSTIPCACDIFT